ncbi:MMPL family transporter [Streptomyces sp. DH12]|uniref:MMPL family transporter n=1 Tax=Streptomyces sp. DH12 TaxID=2857010 RepID=UPI001E451B3F|nr:MMPL family transporter [Streptomyces sp. DH12]
MTDKPVGTAAPRQTGVTEASPTTDPPGAEAPVPSGPIADPDRPHAAARPGSPVAPRMDLLGRVARWSYGHRWWVIGAAACLLVMGAVTGVSAGDRWSNGGYSAGGTAAQDAERTAQRYAAGTPDLILHIRSSRSVDSPDVTRQGRRVTELAARSPGVASALSYWTTGLDPLREADGRGALLRMDLEGDDSAAARTARDVVPSLRAAAPELTISASGPAWVNVTATDQAQRDLLHSELFNLPLVLLVLALAFGSLRATLVPVAIGATAASGTLAVLSVVSQLTPVTVFAVNLSCALGFGLAVDYALFTLSRYREERARGLEAEEAVGRAMSSTGRAVVFCAMTMAWCMAALLVFPLGLIRSLAIASLIVVVFCVVGTLFLLPALVAALGGRIDGLAVSRRPPWRRFAGKSAAGSGWRRIAVTVTGRPLVWAAAGSVLLLGLAAPVLWLRPALMDESILPPHAEARTTSQAIREAFPHPPERQLTVVLPRTNPVARANDLDAYARHLSALPGTVRVSTGAGDYAAGRLIEARRAEKATEQHGTLVMVFTAGPTQSRQTADLVNAVRAAPAPGPAQVAGTAVQLADTRKAVTDALGWWSALMLSGVFVMLLVFTRSLLVAVKAAVLGGLSIGAALGLMVLLFQQLQLLGPPAGGGEGTLEITMLLLAAALAFGLCVDYEVFLVARMAEEWRRTGRNTASIVFGIEHTGRLFTAAALVVTVSMGALVVSEVRLLVVLGATMAAIVVLDATVVRGVLVPAVMQLAGPANWWTPAARRRAGATRPPAATSTR